MGSLYILLGYVLVGISAAFCAVKHKKVNQILRVTIAVVVALVITYEVSPWWFIAYVLVLGIISSDTNTSNDDYGLYTGIACVAIYVMVTKTDSVWAMIIPFLVVTWWLWRVIK